MSDIKRIAIDTSKSVFTLHGVDGMGRVVLRRNLRRRELLQYFDGLAPVEVALEACGGSHHWARVLLALGHRVRLIPPQYVKPFVKRNKNDRNDAEAISVAATQPSIASVPIKSVEQQAAAMLLSVRELLVRQRTQLVNAMRGHAAEMGVVAPLGAKGVHELRAEIAAAVTQRCRQQPSRRSRSSVGKPSASRCGCGRSTPRCCDSTRATRSAGGSLRFRGWTIAALNLALRVDAAQFKSARHFAAWLGLVPRQCSTAGRQRLGGISRAGDERLRQLLVLGATAVIQHAKPGRPATSPWLLNLLGRKPRKLAAVALANKMARIMWAMMISGRDYQTAPTAA